MFARCLLLFALLMPTAVSAHPQVHFILSDDSGLYQGVYEAAVGRLAPDAATSLGQYPEPPPESADILVALGTRAAQALAASSDPRPVFAALVPSRSWQTISVGIPLEAGPRNVLYLDQPLARQLAFIRTLLPPVRTLGVAYGHASSGLAGTLADTAGAYNFRLVTMHNQDAESPTELVARILRRSEALLALPDSEVFNRYTVQAVLLTSFRLRRPVIGYSEAWVKAGAIGAVYSDPEQVGQELGDWLRAGADGDARSTVRWPQRYSLRVNRAVAYSLGLTIPPDRQIHQQVELLEGSR